jgi:hypothetical protein
MVILGFAIGFSAVTLALCHVVALAFVRQMLAHQRKIDELRAEIDMELARHGLTQDQVLEAIEELQKSRVLLDDRVIYSLWRDDTFQIFQITKVTDAA